MRPDELALVADVQGAAFLCGVAKGRWRLQSIDGHIALVEVAARDGTWYLFRFDCQNYPQAAPTGGVWDLTHNRVAPAEAWPKGGDRISSVFNPNWKGGTALYIPCDRQSIDGHGDWVTRYASMLWDPWRGLVCYLELIHELLHSRDYRCAA